MTCSMSPDLIVLLLSGDDGPEPGIPSTTFRKERRMKVDGRQFRSLN